MVHLLLLEKVGNAVSFDGSNDYAQTGSVFGYNK